MNLSDFFKQGTPESSTRLIWIITGIIGGLGIGFIDIKFGLNLSKYTGLEVAAVITANAGYIGAVLYGKVQQMKQE